MNTTTNSPDTKIIAQNGNSHGQETDYPITGMSLIISMRANIEHKCKIRKKYQIGFASYDMLVVIVDKYLRENTGSTTYALAAVPRNSTISSTCLVVNALFKARLIEISGKGVHNCNVYIPSKLALEAFGIVVAA